MVTGWLLVPRPRQPTLRELITRARAARRTSLQLRDDAATLRRRSVRLRQLDGSAAMGQGEPGS